MSDVGQAPMMFCNRAHFVKDGFNKIIYRGSLFQALKVNHFVYEYLKQILNRIYRRCTNPLINCVDITHYFFQNVHVCFFPFASTTDVVL